MSNRDEFLKKTRIQLAKRAGWLCSDPACRRITVGATSDREGEIDIGVASHICAAAPGGPRYDRQMTSAERKSVSNGIWMCRVHGWAIDSHDPRFTVALLQKWKKDAEAESSRRVLYDGPRQRTEAHKDNRSSLLQAAVVADLAVFRRTEKWPRSSVELALQVEGFDQPLSTWHLAKALATLGDLIIVAQPGAGKTASVFQIAESLIRLEGALPIVVALGDWATGTSGLLDSVLKRHAFSGLNNADLRAAATTTGLVLLLDGWNELQGSERLRADSELRYLQAELPELGLVVSTRRQSLDIPLDGKRAELDPLTEEQQLAIAKELKGDAGVRIVETSWRTSGVRELVTTPLYLSALLTLPEGISFPHTKERLLCSLIAAHESQAQAVEHLDAVLHGLHSRFLQELAVAAMRTTSTTLAETTARKCVSDTANILVAEGLIASRPEPRSVLEALVNRHVLTRSSESRGYSFHHQQIQEWYASHFVEHLMIAATSDASHSQRLRAEILNWPTWEEAICSPASDSQQAMSALQRRTRVDRTPVPRP